MFDTSDHQIPTRSLVLGYLPMAPLVIAGILVWFVGPLTLAFLVTAAIYWSAILFFFLAGVRRGLSFFTEGGPQPAQLLTMGLLFALGLVIFIMPYAIVAVVLCGLGFAGIAYWIHARRAAVRCRVFSRPCARHRWRWRPPRWCRCSSRSCSRVC